MDDYSVQMINAHLTKQFNIAQSQVWVEFAVTRDCFEFTALIWTTSNQKQMVTILIPTEAFAKLSFEDVAQMLYYNRRNL